MYDTRCDVDLSICVSSIYLSMYLSLYISIYLRIHQSINRAILIFIFLSINICIYPYIHIYIYIYQLTCFHYLRGYPVLCAFLGSSVWTDVMIFFSFRWQVKRRRTAQACLESWSKIRLKDTASPVQYFARHLMFHMSHVSQILQVLAFTCSYRRPGQWMSSQVK